MVGFTSTIPVEVLFAAGEKPVDLNNLFITYQNPQELVEMALEDGFPEGICTWIMGIYGAVKKFGVKRVVGVLQGDCSNTHVLMEILSHQGVEVIPFEYPIKPHIEKMREKIEEFCGYFGVSIKEAEEVRKELLPVRDLLRELDELTYKEGKVRGFENHLFLVSSSDFSGDPWSFKEKLEDFLKEARSRKPIEFQVKLGVLGVPPIFNFYDFLEEKGALVVFNEVQRQFAMYEPASSLEEQYTNYTYPYGITYRLEKDIKRQLEVRGVQGVIHYVQSFCHRKLEDVILQKELDLPLLTIEGLEPNNFDGRTRLRLESFVEMVGGI